MPLVERRGGLGRGIEALMSDEVRDADMSALFDRLDGIDHTLSLVLALSVGGRGSMTAEEMYLSCKSFIAANPGFWSTVKGRARFSADNGRRFSMKKTFEELRETSAVASGTEWKLCNTLASPLTRFLVEEVPEVAPYVQRRNCKVDKFFNGAAEPPEWPQVDRGGS